MRITDIRKVVRSVNNPSGFVQADQTGQILSGLLSTNFYNKAEISSYMSGVTPGSISGQVSATAIYLNGHSVNTVGGLVTVLNTGKIDPSLYNAGGGSASGVTSGEVEDIVYDIVGNSKGTKVITDGKLTHQYQPQIVSMTTESFDYSKIKFYGDCKVDYGADGLIKIRIGQNLNSSNWNTTDGKTDGIVRRTASSTAGLYPDLLADTNATKGTAYDVYKNTGIITIKPAGLIHFDNNSETYFTANVVLGKSTSATTYYFGKITGNNTYNAKVGSLDGTEISSFTLDINSFGEEANTSGGATGYQANVVLTFVASSFMKQHNKQDFYITAVNHKNGSEATVIWNNTSTIFFTSDTTTKPAISGTPSLSVSATTSQVKVRSGVKYLTGGTVTAGVDGITALADPCAVATKVSVASDNQAWLTAFNGSDSDLTGYNQKSTDTVSFSKSVTGNLKHGQFSDCDIKVTATNCNGSTSTAATTENLKLLVDTSSATGTSDLKEVFNDETRRLADAENETAYDGTTSLVDNNGLQIKNTTLQYPAGDYTDYNDGIGGIVGANQPNYSSLTGDRYYIRKFTIGGTLNSVTVTLVGTNILACKTANTLSFEMMNKQDSSYGATWKNVTYGQTGAVYVGANSTFSATGATLKIDYKSGGAADSVYFRVVMKSGCNATITSITVE